MSERDDEWDRLLDLAVWGFEGEPFRCQRCGTPYGEEHTETCPMPAEVIEPWLAMRARLRHGRIADPDRDRRFKRNRVSREATGRTGE